MRTTRRSTAEAFVAQDEAPVNGNKSIASGQIERWMEDFLEGDVRAFECLFSQLAPRLRRSLYVMTRDPHLAEDLTQTTFLKLVRAGRTYARGMSVEAWVWTIAKRTYLDDRRRRTRKPEILVGDL